MLPPSSWFINPSSWFISQHKATRFQSFWMQFFYSLIHFYPVIPTCAGETENPTLVHLPGSWADIGKAPTCVLILVSLEFPRYKRAGLEIMEMKAIFVDFSLTQEKKGLPPLVSLTRRKCGFYIIISKIRSRLPSWTTIFASKPGNGDIILLGAIPGTIPNWFWNHTKWKQLVINILPPWDWQAWC